MVGVRSLMESLLRDCDPEETREIMAGSRMCDPAMLCAGPGEEMVVGEQRHSENSEGD